jgi:hypothetical protein
MRGYTTKEKAKITAGAVAALVYRGMASRAGHRISFSEIRKGRQDSARKANDMNGNRYYGVRVEGAKYGVGFGSALAIAISYTANHSILWAIIHGILGWLYVIYFALFWS